MDKMDNDTGKSDYEITWINPILFFIIAIFSLLLTIFVVLLLSLILDFIAKSIRLRIKRKRILEKMELYTGKSGSCIICYDDFLDTKVAKISCGHTFHQDCIMDWFERKMICPLCRYQV